MKKRIGLVVFKNQDGVINFPVVYINYFEQFGEVVPVYALDSQVQNLDLLVLPGGSDVNPARYNEKPHVTTQNSNLHMEWFDVNMLPQYINSNIPIFGICRGFQTLAVHFGSKLHQNIPTKTSVPRTELIENLFVCAEGRALLPAIFSNDYIARKKNHAFEKVNSLHHQGVYKLEGGLVPILLSDYNTANPHIEAFVSEDLKIAGVQWHPEEIYDTFSHCVIRKLLS